MADIEEQIRKAEEEGKFRDLPGKGKPLKLVQLQRPFIKTQVEIDRICSAQGR